MLEELAVLSNSPLKAWPSSSMYMAILSETSEIMLSRISLIFFFAYNKSEISFQQVCVTIDETREGIIPEIERRIN